LERDQAASGFGEEGKHCRREQIYRERTSLTSEQIEEFRQHAVFFDAAAAHNAGIVHEVAALRIPPGAAMTVVNTVPTETPR
jgi:hypothetical protein